MIFCTPAHDIFKTPPSPPQQRVNNKVVARYPATQVHSYLQTSLVDLYLYEVLILDIVYHITSPFTFMPYIFKATTQS